MPGANELSTVEWQSAHWMPIDLILPLLVEDAGDADHGVELEQCERGRGIVEIHLAARERALQRARQRVDVHLESYGQRRFGRDAGSDAAIGRAREREM